MTREEFMASTNGPKTEDNYQAFLRLSKMFQVDPEDNYEEQREKVLASMQMLADER